MIVMQSLSKQYGAKHVLSQLEGALPSEQIIGVIGRNGVGKSTLFRLLAGLEKPTGGSVQWDGIEIFNQLQASAHTLLIDEHFQLLEHLTLADGIRKICRFYPAFDLSLATDLLKHFQIPLQVRQKNLSKGMNATFCTIMGICARKSVTMFDESMNGMDTAVRKEIQRVLLKDYVAYPRTILLSSHHMEELEHLLSHVLILHEETILYNGPSDELAEKYVECIGREKELYKLLGDAAVIHQFGDTQMKHAIVERATIPVPIHQLTTQGIQVQRVSLSDSYVYLTQSGKEQIDEIYKKSQFQ